MKSKSPVGFAGYKEPSDFPMHTALSTEHTDLGDDGMVGQHRNDRIMLRNSHPHQSHSVGYEAQHETHENHGLEGFSVVHGRRDKGPEHHPPKGLVEHKARQNRADMQSVMGEQYNG
jgi:hypothetical protein